MGTSTGHWKWRNISRVSAWRLSIWEDYVVYIADDSLTRIPGGYIAIY